jgi:PPOX class probable F420-dependent enzyme
MEELLARARRGVLATIADDGAPRLVPIAFAYADGVIYSALDEKPKSVSDPHELARVRDISQRPQVSVLVDEWDEDWTKLAWLRLVGRASILESGAPEHADAVRLLRDRYPQYASHRLENRPIIRIVVDRSVSWPTSSEAPA